MCMTEAKFQNIDKKNKYNDVIEKLQHYMFTTKHLSKCVNTKLRVAMEPKSDVKPTKNRVNNRLFVPKQKDTLFWLLYILQNGFEDYELIQSSVYTVEVNTKIKMIEEIQKNKSLLKSYKIRKLTECEAELMSAKPMTFHLFQIMCIIYNINIMLIKKRTYYMCSVDENKKYVVIHSLSDEKYGYELNIKEQIFDNYQDTLYRIEHYDKLMKTISLYRADDLKCIATKLCIPLTRNGQKQKTKRELYDDIHMFLDA